MLEQLKYVNSMGQVLTFGDGNGLYVNYNELHDFKWDVISVNDKISGFERGLQTRKVPIRIYCLSKREGMQKRNSLFEIPERDVLRGQYGKLWINGYYCECYVTASTKSIYTPDGQYMACDLEISTDRPYWVKESTVEYAAGSAEIETESEWLDFPYDFAYDYKLDTYGKSVLVNDGFYDCKFRLTISGPVINPAVYINQHLYEVNSELETGDTLVIDSVAKTIQITRRNGEKVNAFDTRNRNSYIFQDIPTGNNLVVWSGSFSFSVALLEERSEPRWDLPEIDSSWDYVLENQHVVEYSPIMENSDIRFEANLETGRLDLVTTDDTFDGVDFELEEGRLIAIYGNY